MSHLRQAIHLFVSLGINKQIISNLAARPCDMLPTLSHRTYHNLIRAMTLYITSLSISGVACVEGVRVDEAGDPRCASLRCGEDVPAARRSMR